MNQIIKTIADTQELNSLVGDIGITIDGNLNTLIESIEDRSDYILRRCLITFKNGYKLSVVSGDGAYGNDDAPYEIAPINLNDNLDGSLLDPDDQGEDIGDDVLGYLTKERVIYYVRKIGSL